MYARLHPLQSLFHLIVKFPHEEDIIISPILQIIQLRLKKII